MHTISSSALESILSNNFDIESAPEPAGREKKMLFGCGIYFSEVLTLILLLSVDVYIVSSDAFNVSGTAKSVFADADSNQRCQPSRWCTATPWSSAEWSWEPARTLILSLDTEFWHSGRSGFPKMRMTNWFSRLKTLQPNVHCAKCKCDLRLVLEKDWI